LVKCNFKINLHFRNVNYYVRKPIITPIVVNIGAIAAACGIEATNRYGNRRSDV